MEKDRIIQELNLHPFGNKGWMHSSESLCMFGCERYDKFGIMFTEDSGICKCMRCGESSSLYNYLVYIGRSDLLTGFSAPIKDEIKSFEEPNHSEEEITPKQDFELPKGFKRIYFDEYLDDRGFSSKDYKKYHIGVSTERKLRFHIVFPIYQNGKLSGWLARSRMSKEWHKKNIKDFKNKVASLVLRYYNNDGAEFSELVGNLDSIREGIDKTVILVEGIFDEQNVSKLLNKLSEFDTTKCCFTFGKSLSENQLKILLNKGIENFILMYDPDALKEIEKFLLRYENKVKSITGVELEEGEDPGDIINSDKLRQYLNKQQSSLEFYQTNIKRF